MGRFFFSSRSDDIIISDAQHPPPSMILSSSDYSSSSIDWIASSESFRVEEPEVISLTLFRSSTDQRLGVKLGKRTSTAMMSNTKDSDEEYLGNQNDANHHHLDLKDDVYVAALDERQDSLLNHPTKLPIQVGDLVISFNGRLCKSLDLETLQEIMSHATGVITICLYKAANSTDCNVERLETAKREMMVHQAVFVQPKQHTCLPMDLDFESQIVSQQRCLTFAHLHGDNDWLSPSCLEVGHIVLAINGSCSYNLEEEDARFFLQTKCELEPCVSITTLGYPNTTNFAKKDPDNSASKDGEIPILGKENKLSSAPTTKQKKFSRMWSISNGLKETEKEKRQREERQLDSKYIQETTLQIRNILREAKNDRSIDAAGKFPMFSPCRKLFLAMKHRMDACARERGTGEVYFQLYLSLSKSFLLEYARILNSSLTAAAPTKRILKVRKIMGSPSSSLSSLSPSSFLKGSEGLFGHDEKITDHEKNLCHIFNTSKFCVDTIEQMEEMVRNTIHDTYAAQVDMTSQQETFDEIAAKAMEFLVSLLSNQIRACAFADMTKLPWKKWDQVQDTNDYVYSICHHVESYISTAEWLLSPAYFCTLCDKLAMDIIETFDSIMLSKCNHTTTTGKQQLLLDVHTLKSFFLGKLVEDHKKGSLVSSWTIYEKMVSEKFQKMEALLRIASVSESDLKDFMSDII
ncbi:unnamed protein product [Cylindrotheca closterium]|uniref:PDZ domain-containing protein n=1 Tax=Cylindrotheca closterium TaxID=2856 RepID=A0AAD2CMH9_9STRA|nr:unnamed protein product [Cylindrotheca closterium]